MASSSLFSSALETGSHNGRPVETSMAAFIVMAEARDEEVNEILRGGYASADQAIQRGFAAGLLKRKR
jgi:hypothetical protein